MSFVSKLAMPHRTLESNAATVLVEPLQTFQQDLASCAVLRFGLRLRND
jgi:hypothetical protein